MFYGIYHQASISSREKLDKINREYKHKEELINKAKAEWAKKTMPAESKVASGGRMSIPIPKEPLLLLEFRGFAAFRIESRMILILEPCSNHRPERSQVRSRGISHSEGSREIKGLHYFNGGRICLMIKELCVRGMEEQ